MNSKTEVWQKRVHSLIPPYLSLSLLIAFSSPALTAHSANTNYQSRILGQQSLGFAGAYTAIAQDPSALYYNPAGLTQAGFSQLGTTLPVYGVEIHWHRQGLRLPYTESTQDLYQENYVNTTASIGLVSQFGTRDRNHNFRWGAGILISVPWNQRLRSQQSIKENSQDYALFTHKQEEQTWLFGPGFAFRWKALSIGLSLFFSYDSFDSLSSLGGGEKKCAQQQCNATSSYHLHAALQGWNVSFQPRLGFLLSLHPRFQVGLNLSLSSYELMSSASYLVEYQVSIATQNVIHDDFAQETSIRIHRPMPWEFRLGFAGWPILGRWRSSLDISLYLPQSFQLLTSQQTPLRNDTLRFVALQINRQFSFNFNWGNEVRIGRGLPLRFGFFTDISAADSPLIDTKDDSCNTQPCLPQQHHFGGTVSVGWSAGKAQANIGLQVMYGRGQAQQIRARLKPSYQWTSTETLAIYLYATGTVETVQHYLRLVFSRSKSKKR